MLPPAWLAIVAALNATTYRTSAVQQAVDIVAHFEAAGWRLVPSYAVDETRIPQGLRVDEAPNDKASPRMTIGTFMTPEEFEKIKKEIDE